MSPNRYLCEVSGKVCPLWYRKTCWIIWLLFLLVFSMISISLIVTFSKLFLHLTNYVPDKNFDDDFMAQVGVH